MIVWRGDCVNERTHGLVLHSDLCAPHLSQRSFALNFSVTVNPSKDSG